jgi:hypothetical protein
MLRSPAHDGFKDAINEIVGAAVCLSSTTTVHAQSVDVRTVIEGFLAAFGNRDFTTSMPYFSDDATVFFPPSAADCAPPRFGIRNPGVAATVGKRYKIPVGFGGQPFTR